MKHIMKNIIQWIEVLCLKWSLPQYSHLHILPDCSKRSKLKLNSFITQFYSHKILIFNPRHAFLLEPRNLVRRNWEKHLKEESFAKAWIIFLRQIEIIMSLGNHYKNHLVGGNMNTIQSLQWTGKLIWIFKSKQIKITLINKSNANKDYWTSQTFIFPRS